MITTIRLTEQDIKDKETLENNLRATLTIHDVYRRGLDIYMDEMIMKNSTIKLD